MPKPLFGSARAGLAGLSTAWSPSTTNATRDPCFKPSCCRTDFGMVTCPLVVMVVVSTAFPKKVLPGKDTIKSAG